MLYYFLYALKIIIVISKLLTFFLYHTHKNTNSAFSSWILSSIAFALFQDFLPNENHITRTFFLILRNTKFHNLFYIWIVTSLKSTTR